MKLKIWKWIIRVSRAKNIPTTTMVANRCYINAYDCEDALKYLNAGKKLKESDRDKEISFYYDHIEGLMTAAIVAYARAFMEQRGEGESANFVKAPLDKIYEGDKNKMNLHKKIMNLRHKAAAHSDNEFSKNSLNEVKDKTAYRKRSSADLNQAISSDLDKFIEMARQAQQYFLKKGLKLDNSTCT